MAVSATSLRTEIHSLRDCLVEEGLAIAYNAVIRLDSSQGTTITHARAGAAHLGGIEAPDAYLAALRSRDYFCVLRDGALVQLSYLVVDRELTAHRLLYQPCPIVISRDDWGDDSLDEVIEVLDELEPHRRRTRGGIRFDYNSSRTPGQGHAMAHAHIICDHCRVPLRGPVSVGRFARFICERFYPDIWARSEELRNWPMGEDDRTLSNSDEDSMWVNWSV